MHIQVSIRRDRCWHLLSKEPNVDLAHWASRFQVVFPPSTKVLYLNTDRGLDQSASLKVRFPLGSWEQFAKSAKLETSAFEGDKSWLLGTGHGPWTPQDVTTLLTAQTLLPEGEVLNIGVDLSDPEFAVVYLFWHST